jgi:hypothetical protein
MAEFESNSRVLALGTTKITTPFSFARDPISMFSPLWLGRVTVGKTSPISRALVDVEASAGASAAASSALAASTSAPAASSSFAASASFGASASLATSAGSAAGSAGTSGALVSVSAGLLSSPAPVSCKGVRTQHTHTLNRYVPLFPP